MASQAQPSIRLWKGEGPEKRAIPFLISRIIDQKGGFKNITEESLQEEITTGESQIEDVGSPEQESGEEEEGKPRAEQLEASRQERLRFVQYAFKH